MTPPDTNTEKQAKRHWAPLAGVIPAVFIGVGVILYWVGADVVQPPATPDSEEPATDQVDGGGLEATEKAPTREADTQMVNPGLDEDTGLDD